MNQNVDSKQTIDQAFKIISRNKSYKLFIRTKKGNQTNIVSVF